MADWKYDGFISYSTRTDAVIADQIQRGLEQLAKRWNQRVALKIFQDVDDLAASPDLSATLRGELEGSNTLVFLASPQSAASPWCGDELAYWIRERPPEQLVVVLTGGELVFDKDASPPVDFGRSTSAPPAFAALDTVPLYIDMRDLGDPAELDHRTHTEFRARLTKIAAALHSNKSGTTIEPRDIDSLDLAAHRKTKRIRNLAITGLTLLAVGVGVATYFAVRSGREAEQTAARELAQRARNDADDDLVAALGNAAEARSVHRDRTTDDALLELLWQSRPLVWTVDAAAPVTGAVPAGDLAVYGTEAGEVVVVDRDGASRTVVPATGAAVVDVTAGENEALVAVAWQDGRVALIDAAGGRLVVDTTIDATPNEVVPYPAAGDALVATTETATSVIEPSGVRVLDKGVLGNARARVIGDTMTYSDGFAIGVDLRDGAWFSVGTGGNRAWYHDAAAGMAMIADDQTRSMSVGPFWWDEAGPPDVVPPSWYHERQSVTFDDVVLSGDGRHAAILDGSTLELVAAPPFEGEAESRLTVFGVPGTDDDSRTVEVDPSATVAVTASGRLVQRWEAGRDVVSPENPPLGALDAYIALRVTETAVEWESLSDVGGAWVGRLDLLTGEWERVEQGAFTAGEPQPVATEPDSERRLSSDGTMSAQIRRGNVVVRDEPSGDVRFVIEPYADTGYLTFTPDDRFLVLASRGGGMEYWPLDVDGLCNALDRQVRPGTSALAGCGTE